MSSMFSIEFTRHAEVFLKKLSKKDAEIIVKKIYAIRNDPFRFVKRLQGNKLWRLRVMDYRVIVDIILTGNKIIVLRIGHRKNIYDI